jgi:hypothetical protein
MPVSQRLGLLAGPLATVRGAYTTIGPESTAGDGVAA